MECLAGAWSIVPCLGECYAKHTTYIGDFKDNLTSLRSESDKLKDLREDVSNRVKVAEEQQMKPRNEVNGWLKRVEAMENEVDEILQKGDQELRNKCLGSCCPKNCRSSYKIGKNVLKMIPRVTKLTEEGQFDVVADELPPPPVDEQLKVNLASLRYAMVKLNNLREDVMNRVKEDEEQHMKRTKQVNGWLTSVEAVEKGSEELESRCVGSRGPKNRGSSYKLLEEVLKMISEVTTLTEEGQFDVVAHQLPPPPVDEQPMDNVVVGFESKFEEVWQSVQNNDSPVIGLVGMGGVGKTTLLKQLNNEFLKAIHAFDLIIWIVVSKSANLKNIRGALGRKLGIPNHTWKNLSEDKRTSLIFRKLKKKKFVVLLDDMWERLEFSEVGIPRPDLDSPGSKIVFTTRSREVCQSMDAYKVIQVDCLPPDEAFNLFYSKLGEDMLNSHPEMRGPITDVASKCEGLPLALIIIGRAMRGKTDVRQWKEAKRMLEKYPSTFSGMQGGVFSKLVFSYDSLPNPMVKKCFEYCSIYPEDCNILEEEVVKLWIAEGFIDEYDSMYDALIQGRHILESLKQACLLETGEISSRYNRDDETVKMHDLIRDMAIWVACERGEKRNKFCIEVARADDDDCDNLFGPNVAAKRWTRVVPNAMTKQWTNAEKISLRGSGISTESLAGMSSCPNLATLIIRDTRVEELPAEIINSMNNLKVLDLAHNYRRSMQLPIKNGCLINLEYLNIGGSKIRIPTAVSQWKKLRFLIVDDKTIIPRGVISSLSSLQMFEQLPVRLGLPVHIQSEHRAMERDMLSELEGLKHIMEIRLVLTSVTGIKILLDSPKLQRCTTRLGLDQVESLPDTLDFGTEALTRHLERFSVNGGPMSEVKLGGPFPSNNLCEVGFSHCYQLCNLSSLIYAPNLSVLSLYRCYSMSELIGEETRSSNVNVGTSLFSSLKVLNIQHSMNLRSICPQSALPFPSLEYINIYKCKSLVRLPLDSNSAKTTPPQLEIIGKKKWWDGLEWDSQETKDAFAPRFIERY